MGTAPRERRRWPVVLVALLVAATTAGAVWIANIEPLRRGSTGFSITDPAAHARGSSIEGLGVSGRIEEIPASLGLTFRYLISIRNDGPLPVRILDAGDPPGDSGLIALHLVGAIPDLYAGGAKRTVGEGVGPFQPFDLAPGTEAGLQLEVRVNQGGCLSPGSYAAWYQVPVTYRLLGITRHAEVDTGIEVRIAGTAAIAC